MANDISYSGTRQGTFMPKLVLVSPSEIFYQLSAPLSEEEIQSSDSCIEQYKVILT
jgi:hypothetical protein